MESSHTPSDSEREPIQSSPGFIETFWKNLRAIILKPQSFFVENTRLLLSDQGLSTALAFAVVVEWIASGFNFIWRSLVFSLFRDRFDDALRLGQVMINATRSGGGVDLEAINLEALFNNAFDSWNIFYSASSVLLAPFVTLMKLLFFGVFIHLGVHLFVKEDPDRPHKFSTTLKILSYSMAPWLLCVIPGIGMLLGYIFVFIAAFVGIREVYKTTTGRAVMAVIFPELLFTCLIMILAIIGLAIFFKLVHLIL